MGARYLTDLAEVCRSTGFPVIEVDGWEGRARGSGGFNDGKPDHVMIHHTASGPSSDGWPDVNYCTFGDDDAPLCNLYLARTGDIYVCAAGGTNTNGSGDCPHLEPDTMNSAAVGIEAGNLGTGAEAWPDVQQDAYLALCVAVGAAYGIPPDRFHAHWEWTDRKVDCAGPSRWASSGSWNMDAFRADCMSPAPAPGPTPVPEPEDAVKLFLIQDPRGGDWFVTDVATFKTYVDSPDTAWDGVAVFGWIGDADQPGVPIAVGGHWGRFLDQLPTTGG